MAVARFAQKPVENKRYFIDYGDWLNCYVDQLNGLEMLTTADFTVVDITDPPLAVRNGGVVGTGVEFYISGGVDGAEYRVDIRVETTSGQIKQDSMYFRVEEE